MVHTDEVGAQLKQLGVKFRFWCRPEVRELPKILFDGEQLRHALVGRYEGGFALLCATDLRVLLVDKKPFYLTLEDIRYDMISDVQYNHRILDATVRLGTVHKTIAFLGYNHDKLRNFTSYLQQQVMIFRQQQNTLQQPIMNPVNAPQDTVSLNPVAVALAASKQRVINPYNMPVVIRRRVSKFY